MERTRRRMMAQVPQSDVVVTNPTHYAVALKYDPGSMAAPKMMAKGVDAVAAKIREIAKEHGIPIVENPPLARGLFAAVDVDEEVTPEFYKAVAEVISYIFKLKRRRLYLLVKACPVTVMMERAGDEGRFSCTALAEQALR
jgi:flagellar biosynthetic protein FlhB